MAEKNIYIDYNYNKNQIKQVRLDNDTYQNISSPTVSDIGLIYYDTLLEKAILWI
jgi:hypothetical protein